MAATLEVTPLRGGEYGAPPGHARAQTANASPAPRMRVSQGKETIDHQASRPTKDPLEQRLRESPYCVVCLYRFNVLLIETAQQGAYTTTVGGLYGTFGTTDMGADV